MEKERGEKEVEKNNEFFPQKKEKKEKVPVRVRQRDVPKDLPVAGPQGPRGLFLGEVLGLLRFSLLFLLL